MKDDPRIPAIRAAIVAFNERDVSALMEFINPEVVSRVAQGLGNPGTFHGVDGYLAMMNDWGEAWSENQLDLGEIELVDDATALVHVNQTAVGAGSGVPVEFETVFLVEFSGTQAIRFEIHPGRDSAMAAL
ncbi:MAG: nuclear transport factor 2 family protein [Actinomycetota bacterium]|nr:nuclear transport factor 2 family protein [Actinomycetota bacterium]